MTINNVEVNTRYGLLAVEIFLSKTGGEDYSLSLYSSYGSACVVYAGMCNYYDVKGLKRPVTFEQIYDYIEAALVEGKDAKDIADEVVAFSESVALKSKTEKVEEASKKK